MPAPWCKFGEVWEYRLRCSVSKDLAGLQLISIQTLAYPYRMFKVSDEREGWKINTSC
jgi:hypothetical protein